MNQPLPSPTHDPTSGKLSARRDFFAANAVAYISTSSPSKSTYNGPPSSTKTPNSSTTSTTKTSKPKATKTSMTTVATSTVFLPSSIPTPLPDSKGDVDLFGRPAVVGGYNLTAGILIYSAFFLAFLVAVCAATIQRAMIRRQYRKQQQASLTIESGKRSVRADDKSDKDPSPSRRGQGPEMSMAFMSTPSALTKKRSLSERALVTDMGPAGGVNYKQKDPVRNYESTRPQQKEQSVRFNGQPSTAPQPQPSARRNGETGGAVGRRPLVDPRLDYSELDIEDAQDSDDYSSPSLTLSASTQQDAYYSGGFVDAIQDYKDYMSPAISQGHPGISGMPNDLVPGIGQSNASPAQGNSNGKPKPKVAYEPYTEYPIPILRSKSTRLPQQMRGGSST